MDSLMGRFFTKVVALDGALKSEHCSIMARTWSVDHNTYVKLLGHSGHSMAGILWTGAKLMDTASLYVSMFLFLLVGLWIKYN